MKGQMSVCVSVNLFFGLLLILLIPYQSYSSIRITPLIQNLLTYRPIHTAFFAVFSIVYVNTDDFTQPFAAFNRHSAPPVKRFCVKRPLTHTN